MLEEQARHLLTEVERQTMGYYMDQYRDGHVGVEQLVVALFELLNTHAKVKTEVFLKENDQTRISFLYVRLNYCSDCGTLHALI